MPTTTRSCLALAAALAGVTAPAVANAAGTWDPARPLSGAPVYGTPTLAFDARGWALATWRPAIGGGRRSASRRPSGSVFAPSRLAPDIGEEIVEALPPAPLVDRSGGVIALAQHKVRHACGLATVYALTPRLGRMNGSFRTSLGRWTVFSHTEPPATALAGNDRGVTVAAWLELQRDSRGRCVNRELVRVAVRRPGRRFGSPITLARGATSGPATLTAAVGRDGAILVAWRRGRAIQVRSRSARGIWGATRSVDAGPVDSLTSVVTSGGSACLLWTRTEAVGASGVVRAVGAAVRRPRATRFSPRILERGAWPAKLIDRPERRAIRLRLRPRGALAAWTSWTGDHLRVQTSAATADRFGAPRLASPAGQDFALGDLAVSAGGRPAIALTSNASVVPSGPFVALGRTDGSFEQPEGIGPGATRINGEALAFSPPTGRLTLVWTQYKTVLASERR